MGFIRVRSAKGPKHEYEVSEAAFKARPDVYVRIKSGDEPETKTTPVVKSVTKVAGKETKK